MTVEIREVEGNRKLAGNPLFDGWYADPEIHLFGDRYYIYPTTSADFDSQTFFEALSSADLSNWTNHGRILDFADIPWSTNRAAWAPSVADRNGRYYIYFSAGDGAGIGVAVCDQPAGRFADPLGKPLIGKYVHGAQPIDAHAFIDDDGRAYLYYGGWRHAVAVRLGDDMISTVGDFVEITPTGYVEGPFMLKRQGKYYFMWSEGNWTDSTYAVAYGVSKSPFGPFDRAGCVLRSDPTVGNGAGHHSVLNIPETDDWYICYHRRPIGESDMHFRVTCLDRLHFDASGEIELVVITAEGVECRPVASP